MRERQERLEQLLADVARRPGVLGAALVSRDGLPVRIVGKQELSRETFSAMSATLMGAAEIALGELDPSKLRRVIAQTDRVKFVILGATPALLLVVYASADAAMDDIVAAAEQAAGHVASVVAG